MFSILINLPHFVGKIHLLTFYLYFLKVSWNNCMYLLATEFKRILQHISGDCPLSAGKHTSSGGKESAAMQKTQVQFLDWEDPLGKGMATHSSNLTWRISQTEEPGRLQSMGLQESDMT